MAFGNGELVFLGIAELGGSSDGGTAGIGKSKHFRNFVEDFADGVVTGFADDLVVSVGIKKHDLGVAAGGDEGEGGEVDGFAVEPVGVDVTFDVIDGVEGFVFNEGEGAGGEGADEEGADEAGAVSDGNGVDVVPSALEVGEAGFDGGNGDFDVGAGGDFGDDAAEGFVKVDLGVDGFS